MKLTPDERRFRIYQIAEADEEYRRIKAECDSAQTRFTRLAEKCPRFLRNLLWSYPGMFYYLHHRMLSIICEYMIFPEEKQ